MSSGGYCEAACTDAESNLLLVEIYGRDSPGVAHSFLDAIQRNDCKIVDITKYLIEGSLSITFMLELGAGSSMTLIKDLLCTARKLDLRLNFRFPDGGSSSFTMEDSERIISINVVLDEMPSIEMVHKTFEFLSERKCQILEIDHRRDNRIENNGEFSKLEFRVWCPDGVWIPEIYLDLQAILWTFGAELVTRRWEGVSRPMGRQLVVFSLSDVLLSCDVLDEVLRQAGEDPKAMSTEQVAELKKNTMKVQRLAGKDPSCVQRVIDNLPYTKDAIFVCRSLKAMGFQLALLTSSGTKSIANAVKKELGIDYVLARELEVGPDGKFTGEFGGEAKDLQFRKVDLLQLMAEREGIEYRNVICVGQHFTGLKRDRILETLETYGPPIYFDASKQKTLAVVLYLLGFSGDDVRDLRHKYDPIFDKLSSHSELKNAAADPSSQALQVQNPQSPSEYSRCVVRLSGERNDLAQLTRVLASLQDFGKEGKCAIKTIKQRTIQSESMICGLELALSGADLHGMLKEGLFACQREGIKMEWEANPEQILDPDRTATKRHVVVLVQKPFIAPSTLAAAFAQMQALNINILRIERLSLQDFASIQVTVTVPCGVEAELKNSLLATSKEHNADIAFQEENIERWGRRLVVFDMDSTLIQQEVIDELAKLAGVREAVSEITERAMQGELDFFGSLRERVALLKGHNADQLFDHVKKNLVFTKGAHELCATLKKLGYKMAVISGGFLPMARHVQKELGLDYAFANTLEVDRQTGNLTGRTVGPVVTPQRKRDLLSMIAEIEGCELGQTIAVGDGANDIPMLLTAGLGVAFCAKPKVQQVANFRVNTPDLKTVLYLIGLSDFATENLNVSSYNIEEVKTPPLSISPPPEAA